MIQQFFFAFDDATRRDERRSTWRSFIYGLGDRLIKVNFDLMRFEGGSFHQNFDGEGFLKMAKHF